MIGTRVEINLDALAHNYRGLRQQVGNQVMVAGVVKANAYGHDMKTMANELVALGCDAIMVATAREAISLRKNGFKASLLVMGATQDDYLEEAVNLNIALTVFTWEQGKRLSEIGKATGKTAKIHIKLDTGFNRLGYKDFQKALEDISGLWTCEGLVIEGLFTHLALKDVESDRIQFEKFDAFIEALEARKIEIPIKHVCDSIGAVAYPDKLYDIVRMGALLYGFCSRPTTFSLIPVMTFKTNIAALKWIEIGEGVSYDYTFEAVRRTRVATLPVGYADGLPRGLSNKGVVYINGNPAPILGLICMDQCMVDVTEIDGCEVGSEVILFDDVLQTANKIARLVGTNRNDILSSISMRVPRVIMRGGKVVEIIDYLI